MLLNTFDCTFLYPLGVVNIQFTCLFCTFLYIIILKQRLLRLYFYEICFELLFIHVLRNHSYCKRYKSLGFISMEMINYIT